MFRKVYKKRPRLECSKIVYNQVKSFRRKVLLLWCLKTVYVYTVLVFSFYVHCFNLKILDLKLINSEISHYNVLNIRNKSVK